MPTVPSTVSTRTRTSYFLPVEHAKRALGHPVCSRLRLVSNMQAKSGIVDFVPGQ